MPTQWKLVFKLINPQVISYYGIWTDESYNIVKQIESLDLNDIRAMFGNITLNENSNLGDAREDFLFNSPMIPNPNYQANLGQPNTVVPNFQTAQPQANGNVSFTNFSQTNNVSGIPLDADINTLFQNIGALKFDSSASFIGGNANNLSIGSARK